MTPDFQDPHWQAVLAELKLMELGTPTDDGIAMCRGLSFLDEGALQREAVALWLLGQFPEWPDYSGTLSYPVKSPGSAYTAKEAYILLPRWSGTYGESRKALAAYLVTKLEEAMT